MILRQSKQGGGTAKVAGLALTAFLLVAHCHVPTQAAPPVAGSGRQSAPSSEGPSSKAVAPAPSSSSHTGGSVQASRSQPSGSVPGGQAEEGSQDLHLPLPAQQEAIAARYRRFENTLLQLAEYLRRTDPDRAELLVRAIGRSQEKRIRQQMSAIISLLSTGRLADAAQRQDDLLKSLRALLELLQSEDRRSSLEAERQRLKKLLSEVGRLIGEQKEARSANERGDSLHQATDKQQRVADRTKNLLDEIRKHDQGDRSGGSPEPGESSEEDGQKRQGGSPESDDSQKPRGRSERSAPSQAGRGQADSEKGKSERTPSEPGQQSESSQRNGQQEQSSQSSGQGRSSQGEQGSSTPQSDQKQQTPGREQLQQAYRQMKEALQKLQDQQRQKASEHQDEAVRKLVEAKEKLEEILRQLREEERGLLLTALEARFRKMLAMQELVYQKTVELSSIAEADRDANFNERARKLSFDENAIGLEADRALQLLRDEGSSVAFPQAVEDMRLDIDNVTRRLERNDVGRLTQAIEQDIIEALKEMLEALEQELAELEKQQEQQQQQQQQPGEPPLVDLLSELKMLKTLQLRINRRTKQIGKMLQGERATAPDLLQQLQELSEREARVQEATYDLLSGRNR